MIMKTLWKRNWKYLLLLLISLGLGFLIISQMVYQKRTSSHNCRFWGIIFSTSEDRPDTIIRVHLDSLQKLGNNNPDGWGIAYFRTPDTETLLPIVVRAEPSAPTDPRYNLAVEDVIHYVEKSCIAHVRSGTSGPTSGIPNPHPFLRMGVCRNIKILFAHNGTLPTQILLELINQINPSYLRLNPPDYAPDYLDSDLYAIFIIEIIDTYLNNTIEECIKTAITKLDSALSANASSGQFNFVMSDGSTLWAVRFSKNPAEGFSLYYYPGKINSNFWVAASEPLDSSTLNWVVVPESMLVVLNPGNAPELMPLFEPAVLPTMNQGIHYIVPNPFADRTSIGYHLQNNGSISELRIYDINGRLIRTLYKSAGTNFDTIIWDGRDRHGRKVPPGLYFPYLKVGDATYTMKAVIVR
ncbi:MAG TPA: T9SS type A sorting domain-containing protein [candidate division WOR-3 bacterium]|uniref:T9SS type A sorting domain-containing protein n=1 Tax=candidate division WOR-3 bacterium TaxID=2052148 RepID=A0A9C9EM03_UNCW3|nr:T9SS type A sorting domain-containing protein [candidate division WOR-3 bacterium]